MELLLQFRPHFFQLPEDEESHRSLGIFFALEPEYSYDGNVYFYKFYLANDSWIDVGLTIHISGQGFGEFSLKGKLPAMTMIDLFNRTADECSYKPEIKVNILHRNCAKPIEKKIVFQFQNIRRQSREVHILPQRLFYTLTLLTYHDMEGRKFNSTPHQDNDFNAAFQIELPARSKKINTRNKIVELAALSRSLDLHYEERIHHSKNKHILEIQLKKFHEYMDKVIQLECEEIEIIHGKGNGILKQKIYESLQENSYVFQITENHNGGSSKILLRYD